MGRTREERDREMNVYLGDKEGERTRMYVAYMERERCCTFEGYGHGV